jgi:hypothetical protein
MDSMASKKPKTPKHGTLIRGADGALYFVTDRKMKAFLVPEKGLAETQTQLDEWIAGKKEGALEAVSGCMVDHNIDVAPPIPHSKRRK